jgi:hypothetical protein
MDRRQYLMRVFEDENGRTMIIGAVVHSEHLLAAPNVEESYKSFVNFRKRQDGLGQGQI